MMAFERLLKVIRTVRRRFHRHDVALANLQAARAELAAISAATFQGKPALADKVRRLFGPHWFLLPADDARQDRSLGDLRAHIARSVQKNLVSLEIGPSYNPILPKGAGYGVTIIDHADQAGLVEKYTPQGVDVSKIEPVDIVWNGDSIALATADRKFDAIVAAHVIEHAPDFVQFLKDLSAVLSEGGAIYLLVPDKRYAFDLVQPLSDVAKILGDHRVKRVRHSFESFYRLSTCVLNDKRHAWGQDGISRLEFTHGDPSVIRPLAEHYADSASYIDTHENYFTPLSFAMITDELCYLGEIDLQLTVLTRARGCEFLAILRRTEKAEPRTAEAYLERKMLGYTLLMIEELDRIRSAARLLAG